jgi:hypothetical protein
VNSPILNREFQHPADGWYQIEAKGQHPNRAAGVVQVIDDEAAQAIVNRFNADAAAGTLRHGHELLVDHEHFAERTDQESRAYGWATQLANRADGIYAQIRWTKTGKEAVDGGDYRFFSTVYDPADLKVLNHAPKHVRPLRLDGLTLTNMNNNRGQRPITNREGAEGGEDRVLNFDPDQPRDESGKFAESSAGWSTSGGERTAKSKAMFEFLTRAGAAVKHADVYGSQVVITTRSREAADKVQNILTSGGFKIRGLVATSEDATVNQGTNLLPTQVKVWRVHANPDRSKLLNSTPHSPGTSPEAQSTATQKPNMKSIAAELGLAPEAAEEAVLGEVRKLKNRADHVTAITTERDALKARNAELEAEQVDGLLAAHGVKEEKVLNRLKPVLAAMKNRDERVAALLDFGFKPAEAKAPAGSGRVLNRGEGKQPTAPAANEQELARQAEAQITEYKLKNRCTYAQARNAVRSAKPELFGLAQ